MIFRIAGVVALAGLTLNQLPPTGVLIDVDVVKDKALPVVVRLIVPVGAAAPV